MAVLPARVLPPDEAPGVVASVERIDAWMAVARSGDRFVYATRLCLPVVSAGAKRMRDLAARDLVLLTRPRSAIDPSIFCYTATRSSKPTALTLPVRPRLVAPIVEAESAVVDALLPILDRAARFGRPCPTDRQLAERARLPVETIQAGLLALSAAGMIRIHAAPRPTIRRVTIVATGAQTGIAA